MGIFDNLLERRGFDDFNAAIPEVVFDHSYGDPMAGAPNRRADAEIADLHCWSAGIGIFTWGGIGRI